MVLTNAQSINASQQRFLLVVDKNRASSSGLKSLLKQFRYKVWCVPTGADALELIDIVMPALVIIRHIDDMKAPDLIRTLKKLDSSGSLPILVASNGKDDDIDEQACLLAGAFTCLRMPLRVETLYRSIQVATESVPRLNIRIDARLPVVVDDRTIKCGQAKFATALSESGLFLLTNDPCPLKTKIHLNLKMAGSILSVDAVVIYIVKQGSQPNAKPGMGLEFTGISDQDQEYIRAFIRDEVKKGISITQRTP